MDTGLLLLLLRSSTATKVLLFAHPTMCVGIASADHSFGQTAAEEAIR